MTDRPIQAEAAPRVPPFAVPTWLRPVTVPSGEHGLAGGWARFTDMDVVQRHADGGYSICRMGLDDLLQAADDRNLASAVMDRLLAPRDPFAGLSMTAPRLMGILNVTPDSFSDGGRHNAPARAIAAARAMQDAGAAIIDIGGESTRPGAAPVTRNQELARVLPVLAGLRDSGAVLSIDTRHAEVMRRAVAGGAGIINDVGALRGDGAVDAAAAAGVPVVMMHMQGTPETMQADPQYGFAPVEILEFLEARIQAAEAAGIPRALMAIDPGYGFGKTVTHNLQLINWTAMLHMLGVPILIGASRKSSIAKISAGEDADQRLPGSLALAMAALRQGAQMLRVHDVGETMQAVKVEMEMLRTL
ncbi:MAG: dihydropteroate synthase [Rhodospirillaceae bacterium]|nr:dihydropteroate synthase [Rhodospirillaceae bacterium]MEC8660728.1 dihydropteroate synthase [Pseudomonadota bacterium]